MSNTWYRPKINLPKTKNEWIWDIIGYTVYFGSLIFLLLIWNTLPQEVPAHYNAAGVVDRWGSKWELLLLPGAGGFTAIFMHILEKFPQAHNYPNRLNESNVEQFYLNSRKMLNLTKNIILLLFFFNRIRISLYCFRVGRRDRHSIFTNHSYWIGYPNSYRIGQAE